MEQNLHTPEVYDFRQYDRLWKRVAPGLEPYPPTGERPAGDLSAVQPPEEGRGRMGAAGICGRRASFLGRTETPAAWAPRRKRCWRS